MDSSVIHWIVSPQPKWKNEDHDTSLPNIVCALHNEVANDLFTSFAYGTDSGSSRKSSLGSRTKLLNVPTITLDHFCDAETNQRDSLSDDFTRLDLEAKTFDAFLLDPNDSTPELENSQGFFQSHTPAYRRCLSPQPITIKLTYYGDGRNLAQAPKTVVINEAQHFQVLSGIVAKSLAIGPESVGFWTVVNKQEVKLSPIFSPRELGFSGELEIKVQICQVVNSGSNGFDQSVGSRIPGTNWVRSFPTRVYKCGLPKNPAPSKTISRASRSLA